MEHTPRMQENRMQDRLQQRSDELGQATSRGMESMTTWLDANQRLWRDVLQLSTEATRENLRLLWEIQSSAVQMWTAPVTGWVQVQKEATTWSEKALRDGMDSIQRAVGAMAENGGHGRRPSRPLEALRSQWPQLRGRIRQQWGQLTDEELDQIQGNPEALIHKLQEHTGRNRADVEQELDRWIEQQQRHAA
jgi:uncharacterized protein YjbJ (UPF0337 family)